MNYVQFHIGDWESGTRLLTPLEKGIYIDLLMLYYSTERPILRSYFDRITRGYTEDERKAFDYVVSQYFQEQDDGFHNARCDAEIAKAAEKSEKARKSIQARWNKAAKGSASSVSYTCRKPDESTDAIRTNNERNTDVLLTKNHKPITNNQVVERVNPINTTGGDFCPTVDDFGAAPEAVPEPPPAAAGAGVTRVKLYSFPDSLPEDWGIAAAKQRPDVSAEAVFLKLRDWLQERQPGQKRSMAMWLRQFLQWVTSERITGSGKPLGREETPEEKQKSIENAERFAAAMRKRLEEANK